MTNPPHNPSQQNKVMPDTSTSHPQAPFCLGNDLMHLPRIHRSIQANGRAFLSKVLTPNELNSLVDPNCDISVSALGQKECLLLGERAGGMLALKESISKALGVGMNGLGWSEGLRWHDVEIIRQPQQAPKVTLSNKALALSNTKKIQGWVVSLSHDGDYVLGTALGYR